MLFYPVLLLTDTLLYIRVENRDPEINENEIAAGMKSPDSCSNEGAKGSSQKTLAEVINILMFICNFLLLIDVIMKNFNE